MAFSPKRDLTIKRMKQNEKNVSTKQCSTETHARLPDSDEHDRWTRRAQTETRQRTQTSRRRDSTQASAPLASQNRSFSFPKSARLLARREFLFLQNRGKRRHCPHFVVVLFTAKGGRARLGITVTRRFGNAVARNCMKRLLREFFRTHQTKISPAQDVLIIPRAGAHTLKLTEITKELGKALALAESAT
jgi:ribonuclease P protein component